MNMFKNIFIGLVNKEKLNQSYLKLKDWLLSLNSIKIIAIVILNCFLLTAVYGQTVTEVLESQRETEQFKQIFDDFDVPYSYGKITVADYKGSDTVVITIQDLHNNAEVQKNINNIIALFDEKYGVNNIYLEGAYGQVSTKWLTALKNKKIRNKVLEALLESGRLTGAEYYSAVKNKTEIIKGLEKKEEYFDNLKRFGTILENSPVITMHVNAIKDTVKELQSKYYNNQQKQIEKLSQKYELEQIPADKYFEEMKKYAQSYAMDVSKYKNLSMYMDLLDRKDNLDYEKVTEELQTFVMILKERIPYNVYKSLVDATKGFSQIDKLYGYLIRLSKKYNLNLSGDYEELEQFFKYIELSQAINPFELLKEEQNFKDELNDKFSVNKVEQEVIFLSNFVGYYEDYLTGKITAQDYEYYKANIEKFKYLWVKYIDNREIIALEGYEKISDEFYKINIARNSYFIENMKDVLDAKKIEGEVKGADEIQKSINSLKKAKELYITVTGGFHTQEMSEMLSEAGITNIIITPNVTTETIESDEIYYNLAKEQAKIAFQALATLPLSQHETKERVQNLLESIQKEGLQDIITVKDLQTVVDEVVKEVNDNISDNNKKIKVTVNSVNSAEIQIGNEKSDVVIKNEKEQQNNRHNNLYKSVESILGTMKVSGIMSIVLGLMTVASFPIFVVTGSIPLVIVIGTAFFLSLGQNRFESKQYSLLNKGAQEISFGYDRNISKDITEEQIKDNIAKSQIAFSDDSSDLRELKNRINSKFQELGFKASDISDIKVDDFTKVEMDELAHVNELKQRLKTGFLHINYRLINKIFMKGTNFKDDIWSNAYLSMFIYHELRHKNHPTWGEWLVSFFDIFCFIHVLIGELYNRWFVSKPQTETDAENIDKKNKFNMVSLKQRLKLDLLNDKGIAKDDDLRKAIKTFRQYMKEKNGANAEYSAKTNNEIALAVLMLEGKIGILEVGGGKSEAFNLAMAYLYKKGDTSLLYTTSSKGLTYRDVKEKVKFLNDKDIKKYLEKDKVEVTYIQPGTAENPNDKVYVLSADENGNITENKQDDKLDYNIFKDTNRIFFAQQEVYSYLKQKIDKGEIKGNIPKFSYLADEADYIINKPTDYAMSDPITVPEEKKEVIKLIQANINIFKEKKLYTVNGKQLDFNPDNSDVQQAIEQLKEEIKKQRKTTNKGASDKIINSNNFVYMIESALKANYVQVEKDDYIVKDIKDIKDKEDNNITVIQIKDLDGTYMDPNVKNEETLHLALLAYQEEKATKEGRKLEFKWEGSRTSDKENVFGFLNWDNLANKCLATGTKSLSLKKVGEVVELESEDGAKDVKVGLYVEQTEQAKREKISKILDSFLNSKSDKNKTAFIFESDAKAVQELKDVLLDKETKLNLSESDILILDGTDGESFENNKDKIQNGEFKIVIATQMLDRGVNLNELKSIDRLGIRAYPTSYSSLIQQEGRFGRGDNKEFEALINIYSVQALEKVAKSNGLDKYDFISTLNEYLKDDIEEKEKDNIVKYLSEKVTKTDEATYTDFIKAVTDGTIENNILLRKNKTKVEEILTSFFKMLEEQAVSRAKFGMELAPLQNERKNIILKIDTKGIKELVKTKKDIKDEEIEKAIEQAKLKVLAEDTKEQENYSNRVNIEFSNQSKSILYGLVNEDVTSMIARKLSSGLDELQEKEIKQVYRNLEIELTAQDKAEIIEYVNKIKPVSFFGRVVGKILKVIVAPMATILLFGAVLSIAGAIIPAITISPIAVVLGLIAVVGIFILKKTVTDRINAGITSQDNVNIVKATQTGKIKDLKKSLSSVINKVLSSAMTLGLVSGFFALIAGVVLSSAVLVVLAVVAIGISLISGIILYVKNREVLAKQELVMQDNTAKNVGHTVTGLVTGGIIVLVAGAIAGSIMSAVLAIPIGIVALIGFLYAQYVIPQKQGDHFVFNLKTAGLIGIGAGIIGMFSMIAFFSSALATISAITMAVIPMMIIMITMSFISFTRMQKRVEGEKYGIKEIILDLFGLSFIYSLLVAGISLSTGILAVANIGLLILNPVFWIALVVSVGAGIVFSKMLKNEKDSAIVMFAMTIAGIIFGATGRTSLFPPAKTEVSSLQNTVAVSNAQYATKSNMMLQNFSVSDEVFDTQDNEMFETETEDDKEIIGEKRYIDVSKKINELFTKAGTVIKDFIKSVGTVIKNFIILVGTSIKKVLNEEIKIEIKTHTQIEIGEKIEIKFTVGDILKVVSGIVLLIFLIKIIQLIWKEVKIRRKIQNEQEREFIKNFLAYFQVRDIYIDSDLSKGDIKAKLKLYLLNTENGNNEANFATTEENLQKYVNLIKSGVIKTDVLYFGISSWFSSWFTSFTPSFKTIEDSFKKYYESVDVLGKNFIDYIPFHNKNNSIVLAIDYMIKFGVGKEKIQEVISKLTAEYAPDDTEDKKIERKITKAFYNDEGDSVKLEKLKEKLIGLGSDKVETLSDLLNTEVFNNAKIQEIHYYKNVYDEDKLIVYYKNDTDNNIQNEKIKVAEFTISAKLTKAQKNKLIALNTDNKTVVGKTLVNWIFNNRKAYGIKLITEYIGLDDIKNVTVNRLIVDQMLDLYINNGTNINVIQIPILENINRDQVYSLLEEEQNNNQNNIIQNQNQHNINIKLCDAIRKLKNILKKEEPIKNIEDLKTFSNKQIEYIEYYEKNDNNESRYNLLVYYKEGDATKKIRLTLNNPLDSDKLKKLNSIHGNNLFDWIVGNYQYYNIDLNWPAWAGYEKFSVFKDEEIYKIELKDEKIKIKFKNRIRAKDVKDFEMLEENLNRGVPIKFNDGVYEIEIPVNRNITEPELKNVFRQFKNRAKVPSFYSFLFMCKDDLGLMLTDDKPIEKIIDWDKLSNEKVQDVEYYKEKDELVVYYKENEDKKGVILPLYKKLTEEQENEIKNYSKLFNKTVTRVTFNTRLDNNNNNKYEGIRFAFEDNKIYYIPFVKEVSEVSQNLNSIINGINNIQNANKKELVVNCLRELENMGAIDKTEFGNWISRNEQSYGIILKDKYKELSGIETGIIQRFQLVPTLNDNKKVDKIKVYFKNKTNGYDFVAFELNSSMNKAFVKRKINKFNEEVNRENNVYKYTLYSFIEFIKKENENNNRDGVLNLKLTKVTEIVPILNDAENAIVSSIEPITNDNNNIDKIQVNYRKDNEENNVVFSLANNINQQEYERIIGAIGADNINEKNINAVVERLKEPLKLNLEVKIKKSEQQIQINDEHEEDSILNEGFYENDEINYENDEINYEDDEINTDSNRKNENNNIIIELNSNKKENNNIIDSNSNKNKNANAEIIKKLLEKGFKLELLDDNGNIKDKELEKAIDAFRKDIVTRYGNDAGYSEQTNNQIALAILIIAKKIGVLEVGEGKSEAFNLAMAYLYKKGDTSLLYTTSSKNLTFRDAKEKLTFLNRPNMKKYLNDNGEKHIEMIYIEPGTAKKPGNKVYTLKIEDGNIYANNQEVTDGTLKNIDGNSLNYNIFLDNNNRLFFAQQEVYSYLKQQIDKGEIKGNIPNFSYLADEADYIINKPTDYAKSQLEQFGKTEKIEIVQLIQKNIDNFKIRIHFELKGKTLKFYKDVAKTQDEINKLKDKIKATQNYQNNKDKYNAILDSGEFVYMIEAVLNANYTQKEGDEYIVTDSNDENIKVIQIKGQNGEYQEPNVQNEENLHLAIIAYQKIKKGVNNLEWKTANISDKENIFGFLNWDKLKNKCLATGTDSPSLKEVGEVVKLESVKKAENVEVGLYIEQNEDNKRAKIASVLKEFLFAKSNKKKTAFIFEKDLMSVKNLKDFLLTENKNEFKESEILVLDGTNGETFEDKKDKIQEGKYKIVITTQLLDRGVNLNELKDIDKLGIRAYPTSYSSLIQQEGRFGRGERKDAEALINIYSIEALNNVAKSNGLDKYEYISSLQNYLKNDTEHIEKNLIAKSLRKKISKTAETTYTDFIKAVTDGTTETLKGNLLLRKNKSDIEAMLTGFFKLLDVQAVSRAKIGMALAPLQERRKKIIFDFKIEKILNLLPDILQRYGYVARNNRNNRNLLEEQDININDIKPDLESILQKAKLKVWSADIKEQGKYSAGINIEFKSQSKKTLFGIISGDATSMIANKLSSGLDELQEKLIDQFLDDLALNINAQDRAVIKNSVEKPKINGNFLLKLTGILLKFLSMSITIFLIFIGIIVLVKYAGIVSLVVISPGLVIVALLAIVGLFILKKKVIDRINAEILTKDNINIAKAAQTGNASDLWSSLGSVINKVLSSIISVGLVSGFMALIVGVLLKAIAPAIVPVTFTLAIVAIIISLLCILILYLKNKAVLQKRERVLQDNSTKRVTHTITGLVVGGIIVIMLGLIKNFAISAMLIMPVGMVIIALFLFAQYIIAKQQGDYFAFNWKVIGLVLLGTGLMGGFSAIIIFGWIKVILSIIGGIVIIPMTLAMSFMSFLYFYRMQKRVEGENYGLKKMVYNILAIPLTHSIVSSVVLSKVMATPMIFANILAMLSNPIFLIMFIGSIILGVILAGMLRSEKNTGLVVLIRTLLGFLSEASGKISPTVDTIQYEYIVHSGQYTENDNMVLQNFNASDRISDNNIENLTESSQQQLATETTQESILTKIKNVLNKELFEIAGMKFTVGMVLGVVLAIISVLGIILLVYEYRKKYKLNETISPTDKIKNQNDSNNLNEEMPELKKNNFNEEENINSSVIKSTGQITTGDINKNDKEEVTTVISESNPLTEELIDKFDNKKIERSEYEQNDDGTRNIVIYYKDGDIEKSVKLLTKDKNLIKPENNTNMSLADWLIGKIEYLETKINFNSDRTDTINRKGELLLLKNANILGFKYDKNNNRIIVYHRKEKSNIRMAYFSVSKELTATQKEELENLNNSSIIGNILFDWILDNKDVYGISVKEDIRSLTELIALGENAKIQDIECYKEEKTDRIKIEIEISYEEDNIKKEDRKKQSFILFGPVDKEGKVFEKLKKYNVDSVNKPDIGKPIVSWILSNLKSLKIDMEKIDETPITNENELDSFSTLRKESTIEGMEYYQDKDEKKIIFYYKEKDANTGNELIKGVVFSVSDNLTDEQIADMYTEIKDIKSLSYWIKNTKGIKLRKQFEIKEHNSFFSFDNTQKDKINYDISYQSTKLLSIKDNKITVENSDKIKNVYLNLEAETMGYYEIEDVQKFYNKNSESLKIFITENDIDTEDFFIRVALNKAIFDFVSEKIFILTDENKEKLKEYFFSNLISILEKRETNEFIKKFSTVNYSKNSKSKSYTYNNYFFKFAKDIKEVRLLKNEYDFYNKVKEDKELNEQLGKNINEYYGCYDKKIDNKQCKFIVSKNLTKDNKFETLDKALTDNKNFNEKQCIRIIEQVLKIHSDLEQKGLYNFDLKLQNIMIDKDFNVKLIDYEGIVPKDCTNLISSSVVPYADLFLTDETLRSAYYDYIKFAFIVNVFANVKNLNEKKINDFKKLKRNINYIRNIKINNISAGRKTKSDLQEISVNFIQFFKKYADYFNKFNFGKDHFNKIHNIIAISINLFQSYIEDDIEGKKYKNIWISKLQKIDSKLLENKIKDDIYIIKDIVIDKSNKLVRVYNGKFIKKREKGDWFNPVSWYYNSDSKEVVFNQFLYKFMEYIQIQGTEFQKIADESVPIDDTNMLQRLVLGTLIKKFIDDNKNSEIKDNNEQTKNLYNIFAKKYADYFSKDKFKEAFMQIIEADSELLNSFFNFSKECKLIKDKTDDNKFYLNFSSGLKLELGREDLDKIEKKFSEVKIYDEIQEEENMPLKTGSAKVKTEYKKEEQRTNFVSPIENIKFDTISENYKKLFAIQLPVIRDKDGKILTDDKYNKIKLKLNVVYTKEKGISYQFIGQSEEIVNQLIGNGKLSQDLNELKPIADFLFIDRYSTDKNLRDEIENNDFLRKTQIKEALSDYVNKDEDKNYYDFKVRLIEQGYTVKEIEQILSDTPNITNTHVGLKDVELKLTNQLLVEREITREIMRLKRAGIHKVVLLKDKEVSNEDLYKTIERIRQSGLQPIIGLTKEMLSVSSDEKSKVYDFIEKSIKIKTLSGFRFMFDIDEDISKLLKYKKDIVKNISILDLIMNSGIEISYKLNRFNNDKTDNAEELFKGKVIYVVAGKQFTSDAEENLVINRAEEKALKKLAGEGRLSLYFDMDKDKDSLKLAKALVEKIFGKGTDATKTMISLGTTFTTNMFAELFKKDSASKGFGNAYEIGYEPIFRDISPDIVAGVFKDLLTDNMNFNEFLEYEQREKKNNSEKAKVFTKEFDKLVIEDIKEEVSKYNISEKEQTAMLKQYVIGLLISYIENHFDELYEIKQWDKMIDIKQMDINVKNQIMYRILLLLLKEMSFSSIKQYVSVEVGDNQNESSMKQIVNNIKNNELSVNISKMLMKTDMNINSVIKNNIDTITICNDINMLLEDSLLPIATNELPNTGNLIKDIKNIVRKA